MPNPPYPYSNPFIKNENIPVAPNVNPLMMTDANYLQMFDESNPAPGITPRLLTPDKTLNEQLGYPFELQTNEGVSTPEKELFNNNLLDEYYTEPAKLPFEPPFQYSMNPYSTINDKLIAEEQNRLQPDLIMPNTAPSFVGEHEKARMAAGSDNLPNETIYDLNKMLLVDKQTELPNVDVPNFTNTTFPPKKLTKDTIQKNKMGIPEAYYLGKAGLDATALISNMIQPQPPSIQMKRPFFERMRMNREPYDTMRTNMREQGTQAMRYMRENVSQASDLMKGITAMTSATQQGLKDVGMQEAAQMQQIDTINQNIASQESQAQADILNKEAIANYGIQEAAQKHKDSMVSAQFAALGSTVGAAAKYVAMKAHIDTQNELNKSTAQLNNELQATLVENEIINSALESQDFIDYKKVVKNQEMSKIQESMLGDEKYKNMLEYYGGVAPEYATYVMNKDKPETYEKLRMISAAKRFEKQYPEAPNENDYTPEEYTRIKKDYDENLKYYNEYQNNPKYRAYESEIEYWNNINEQMAKINLEKLSAESYLRDRQMPTQSDIYQKLKALTERTRQII